MNDVFRVLETHGIFCDTECRRLVGDDECCGLRVALIAVCWLGKAGWPLIESVTILASDADDRWHNVRHKSGCWRCYLVWGRSTKWCIFVVKFGDNNNQSEDVCITNRNILCWAPWARPVTIWLKYSHGFGKVRKCVWSQCRILDKPIIYTEFR